MWADQTASTATSGYLQPKGANIVSNLNPYAKEFYPSHLKSWRLNEDSDTKVKQLQLKNYTVLEGPRKENIRVYSTTKELIDVKYNATMHPEMYETLILDTKIQMKLQSKNEKIAKPALQKNIPTTANNVERSRTIYNAKSNCLATSAKSATAPQRNAQVLKLSSGIQPPDGAAQNASTSVTTKSKLVTKCTNPKLVIECNGREMPSKSTNKDCLSIKSGTSSDKSISSIKVSMNSSSNRITATTDKPIITRPAPHNRVSSKNLEKSGASSKTKQVTIKSPRGTVASTLRKTETQKRRNLFPYDPVLNIEMSEFLFK